MTGFFDPPPPPEPGPGPPRDRRPPWAGAPAGTLPGVVAAELLLAATDDIAVTVGRIAAYPEGFECEVRTVASAERRQELDLDPFELRSRGRAKTPPPGFLRFGLRFADGSKVTNVAWHFGRDRPDGPVMESAQVVFSDEHLPPWPDDEDDGPEVVRIR